jgi:hypothetical protein
VRFTFDRRLWYVTPLENWGAEFGWAMKLKQFGPARGDGGDDALRMANVASTFLPRNIVSV